MTSKAAVRRCEENGLSVVREECVLLFLREGPRFRADRRS